MPGWNNYITKERKLEEHEAVAKMTEKKHR